MGNTTCSPRRKWRGWSGNAKSWKESFGNQGDVRAPDALFVIDTKKEAIAVQEARKLNIPIIGVADTNCDPDEIDYIIPGNDDALRAIRLITNTIAQALLDGRAIYEAQQKELADQMEKQRQLQAQQAAAEREARARAEAHRRAAEAKEGGEPSPAPAEGAAPQAEAGAKPKTTLKKTLQARPGPAGRSPRLPQRPRKLPRRLRPRELSRLSLRSPGFRG